MWHGSRLALCHRTCVLPSDMGSEISAHMSTGVSAQKIVLSLVAPISPFFG